MYYIYIYIERERERNIYIYSSPFHFATALSQCLLVTGRGW